MIDIFYYGMIIDTNAYAGNFERDMCAYITGAVGDCGVGLEIVSEVPPEIMDLFENVVKHVDNKFGLLQPCSIFESPNGEYNSVIIFLEDRLTDEQIEVVKKRAHEFVHSECNKKSNKLTEIVGFRYFRSATFDFGFGE